MRPKPNPFLTEPKKTGEAIRDPNGAAIEFYFEEIFRVMEENPRRVYNQSFIDSLFEQWEEWGRLSEKQFEALQNIYERVTE